MSKEEIPAFIFQFKEEAVDNLIEMIRTLSPIYSLSKVEDKLIVKHGDKSLPFYDEPIAMHEGDYLVPEAVINGSIIFGIMSSNNFERKYLVGRA